MNDFVQSVIVPIGGLGLVGYFFWMWCQDYRDQFRGEKVRGALPGATPVGRVVVLVAIAGSLVLLAAECAGEYALGMVEQQTEMTLLFALYSVLAASFGEELIFRGFLFYDRGGKALLVVSCLFISLVFALLHPYLWRYDLHEEVVEAARTGGYVIWSGSHKSLAILPFDPKGLFSTTFIFLGSLWWYYVRFFRHNPRRSLIPCFAGHAAKNLGVVLVKAAQGFLAGLY